MDSKWILVGGEDSPLLFPHGVLWADLSYLTARMRVQMLDLGGCLLFSVEYNILDHCFLLLVMKSKTSLISPYQISRFFFCLLFVLFLEFIIALSGEGQEKWASTILSRAEVLLVFLYFPTYPLRPPLREYIFFYFSRFIFTFYVL